MKKIKFIFPLFFLFFFSSVNCNKKKTEAQYPGISVYKTNSDYLDKITAGIKNNKIYRGPYDDFYFYTNTDTIFKGRIRLSRNYIIDTEADLIHDAFLDFSFKDFKIWTTKYGKTLPDDTIWKHILDKDPYVEFYRIKDRDMFFNDGELDTTGLNQIILDNELEKYFYKLK